MKLDGIYVRAIGSAFGSETVDNIAQAAGFEKDADFLRDRIGTTSLSQAGADESAVELAARATAEALSAAGLAEADIDLVIFVTQNPDHGGLPHNAAVLQHRAGLRPGIPCFDVGLGCSGFVYGASIAAAMLKASGGANALVVTSDQYRRNLVSGDINTQLLFGDAAAATVLSRDGGAFELRASRLGTDGKDHAALIRRADGITMNGRAVFSFSRTVVPAEITAFAAEHGFGIETIDALLLHQGSRAIVEEIRNKLELPPEKVPNEMEGHGNTVSSSIPLLLKQRLADPTLSRIVAAGFGVGLSWGTLWLERKG